MKKSEMRTSIELENHGQKMFGVLHRPLTQGKVPAVLICHGLDGTKVSRYRLYVTIAEKLAERGIATLRLDFRGCGDSEGHFGEVSISGNVEDALAGLRFLEKNHLINSSRMGLIGRSLGGAVGVKAASLFGNIKSLVLLSPLFGTPGGFKIPYLDANATEKFVSNQILQLTGRPPCEKLVKEMISLNVENSLNALQHLPLLHVHGLKDDIVGIDQAEHYERCRRVTTAQTKFVPLEKSTHEYQDSQERLRLVEETVDWLSKTL